MKKIILSIFSIISMFNISCKKENKVTTYTIKGKVVQSCTDDTPVAGLQLFLKAGQKSSSIFGSCNENKSVTTDNEGNFSITYTEDDVCGEDVLIVYALGPNDPYVSLMNGFPPYPQWRDNGKKEFQVELHKQRMIYENYKIKTINSYTNKDTLYLDSTYYGADILHWKKVAGPFKDNDVIYSKKEEAIREYVEGQQYISPYYKSIMLKTNNSDSMIFITAPDPIYKNCDTHTDLIFELP